MRQTLSFLGAIPNRGIEFVRVHFLLDLVEATRLAGGIAYEWALLDEALDTLLERGLRPFFELMGNPSGLFDDFEDLDQLSAWRGRSPPRADPAPPLGDARPRRASARAGTCMPASPEGAAMSSRRKASAERPPARSRSRVKPLRFGSHPGEGSHAAACRRRRRHPAAGTASAACLTELWLLGHDLQRAGLAEPSFAITAHPPPSVNTGTRYISGR